MQFDLPKDPSSIIKVIGVGGGGSNAVNHMFQQGIKGVDFLICNTDRQALDKSPVPLKICIGESLTKGMGAGSIPEVGRNAAIESIEEIKSILKSGTEMVFITAGMGGGTGTGAAPVIAQAAKEQGILTVGIVTIPFTYEGKKKRIQAENGIRELRNNVDTLLLICNDRLREMYGNLTFTNAFSKANDVLLTAAKGIAEVISIVGNINVDLNDVKTAMTSGGVAVMGSATADGEKRATKAVELALSSPLLNDNNISGARHILLYITYGAEEIMMDEITEITDYIQEEAGLDADMKWGIGQDESLGKKVGVTVIATGFKSTLDMDSLQTGELVKKVMDLHGNPAGSGIGVAPATARTPREGQKPKTTVEPPRKKETTATTSSPKPKSQTPIVQRSIEWPPVSSPVTPPLAGAKTDNPAEPYLITGTGKPLAINNSSESIPPSKVASSAESNEAAPKKPAANLFSGEEQQRKSSERHARLKDLATRLRGPSGISDLEKEPAFKRRNIALDSTPLSSDSEVSRYTLTEEENENGEKRVELKPNNPFLHDNVD